MRELEPNRGLRVRHWDLLSTEALSEQEFKDWVLLNSGPNKKFIGQLQTVFYISVNEVYVEDTIDSSD